MDSQQQFLKKSAEAKDLFLPHLSTDPVVFGFDQSELKVLLLQMTYRKQWLLPGGYVKKEEDIDDAAKRVLKERAGISDVYLEEFAVFGKNKRSEFYFEDFDDSLFQKQRFVSIGYYALYNPDNANLVVDELSEKCEWISLSQLSEIELAMDHREIIEKALLTLRERISYKPIGYNLLPEKFTLSELQKLYETILGKELNRGNFYRKIKNLEILKKLNEQRRGGAHKSPDLYSFDEENYKKALENGLSNW
ncbi:NUDIX domain-containing protein [Chryseobacterium sp. Ch-15]|uniref:NUDIX domain-containing protein n=1 Tax=Chryseobacterium muglaense TaxID=2893752 RepID=A0A9Q3UPV8_9FLAO|nr:NUDIX domain-containing protein [Chryseobacterium muglaense]MBD3904174.1 NUDIX domain-containing protein [Chryseobacterium muglaense]MCC9033253.1 NUDIX domain-containing protein [Chryseobacterium muglaense]MCM2553748.1 NUDIX domain-containing protein [Chryseobacterium muglaense]